MYLTVHIISEYYIREVWHEGHMFITCVHLQYIKVIICTYYVYIVNCNELYTLYVHIVYTVLITVDCTYYIYILCLHCYLKYIIYIIYVYHICTVNCNKLHILYIFFICTLLQKMRKVYYHVGVSRRSANIYIYIYIYSLIMVY